jgi:hypothetical protein
MAKLPPLMHPLVDRTGRVTAGPWAEFFQGTESSSVPAGTGDVVGPAGAIDNDFAVFDGPTGKLIKDGGTTLTPQFAAVGVGVPPEAGSALKVQGHAYLAQYDAGNSGAAKTIDWQNGNEQILVIDGNTSFTFVNGKAGARYVLRLKTAAGGPWSLFWPTSVVWAAGTPPEPNPLTDGLTLIAWYCDGTNYIGAGTAAASPDAGRAFCSVYLSTDFVANTGVPYVIDWDVEYADDLGMHDNGNPSVITVLNPGVYQVTVGANWSGNLTEYMLLSVRVNGTIVATSAASNGYGRSPAWLLSLSLGDTISVVLRQSNGVAKNVYGGNFMTFCQVFQVK